MLRKPSGRKKWDEIHSLREKGEPFRDIAARFTKQKGQRVMASELSDFYRSFALKHGLKKARLRKGPRSEKQVFWDKIHALKQKGKSFKEITETLAEGANYLQLRAFYYNFAKYHGLEIARANLPKKKT